MELWGRLTSSLITFSEQGRDTPISATAKLGDLSISRFEDITTVADPNNHWELDLGTRALQHTAFPDHNKTQLPQTVVEQFSYRHLKVALETAVQAEYMARDRRAALQSTADRLPARPAAPLESNPNLLHGTEAWAMPFTILQNAA